MLRKITLSGILYFFLLLCTQGNVLIGICYSHGSETEHSTENQFKRL